MNIQQDPNSATYKIDRFEEGKIWINHTSYASSVIIRAHELIEWPPRTLHDIKPQDFTTLIDNPPTILILGTGQKLIIPAQELLTPLFEKGIGVEFMDSKAACYTFTILSSEQRNVAACILIS